MHAPFALCNSIFNRARDVNEIRDSEPLLFLFVSGAYTQ